jgi:hypothetical protein
MVVPLEAQGEQDTTSVGCLVNNNRPPPLIFISDDSKWFSVSISRLFSTLAWELASVDSK